MVEKYLVDSNGTYYAPQPLLGEGKKFSPIELVDGKVCFDSQTLALRREQNRKMVDETREVSKKIDWFDRRLLSTARTKVLIRRMRHE